MKSFLYRHRLFFGVGLVMTVAVVIPSPAGDRSPAGGRVEISQRLVQAVVRMGFLGPDGVPGQDGVRVRLAGRWIGLAAAGAAALVGFAWMRTTLGGRRVAARLLAHAPLVGRARRQILAAGVGRKTRGVR